MIGLDKADFEGIGVVSNHCDQRKLDIAIEEAILFDLKRIFCDFFFDINENWDSTDPEWDILINGGSYINCRDNDIEIKGLKVALTYFSYARYAVINSYDETPNGQVSKTNQFSIPKPLKELQQYSNKYIQMALILIQDAKDYICSDRDFVEFDNYDFTDCSCDCEQCDGKTKVKGYGLKGKNISKQIYGLY